jgi:hypothetical protein|tara:strand:- start:3141 stop:3287 length:147 start_codon:yes stop_codon:yes gene_type:complete
MNNYENNMLNVLSGRTPIKVDVRLDLESVLTIFIAFIVANVIARAVIK